MNDNKNDIPDNGIVIDQDNERSRNEWEILVCTGRKD